jgi:hypothetical protein
MEYSHHAAFDQRGGAVTGVAVLVGLSRLKVRDDAAVQF